MSIRRRSCRSAGPSASGRRPASTTAPTAAIRSSSEAASNGIRKRSSSSLPIASGDPNPSGIVAPSVPSDSSAEPRTAIESSMKRAPASSGARIRWPGIASQSGSSNPPT